MRNMPMRSQCCGAKIRLFGQRRRQCTACHKTWRVRPKKRGRSHGRRRLAIIKRVFKEKRSLQSFMTRRYSITPQALSHRFRQTLCRFAQKPSTTKFPPGPLIFLIDGLLFGFGNHLWTLYLGAVKPLKGNHAVFLDPLLLPGRENFQDWIQFMEALPGSVKSRVKAMVCDNFRGAKRLARENGWILKICHFHLICQLQARRGHWKRRIVGTNIRE